ncbi:hypothetical protein FHU42_002410 [Corynebacterium glutamicum]|nr:hypothetical protein [Corynebacterium glutamicum]
MLSRLKENSHQFWVILTILQNYPRIAPICTPHLQDVRASWGIGAVCKQFFLISGTIYSCQLGFADGVIFDIYLNPVSNSRFLVTRKELIDYGDITSRCRKHRPGR